MCLVFSASYEDGRRKEKEAEETSNLESQDEEENLGRGARKYVLIAKPTCFGID